MTIPVKRRSSLEATTDSARLLADQKYQLICFLKIYKEFRSLLQDGLRSGIVIGLSVPSKRTPIIVFATTRKMIEIDGDIAGRDNAK